MEQHWEIASLISSKKTIDVVYSVVILNRPLTQDPALLVALWNNASVTITVDGGTRQWDTFQEGLPEEIQAKLNPPDFITGDFDSITEEVMVKYTEKGCKVIHTPDQDYTDFTKALIQLNSHCNSISLMLDTVIVLGQASGRIDQIMGNIQTLFLVKQKELLDHNTKVYLMSDDSLSWLLNAGEHQIDIPEHVRNNSRSWCSLVPIGEECTNVTTEGLKWNIESSPLKFGKIVSTSNTYDGSPTVKIKCSHPLLWSMRIASLKEPRTC